MDPIPEKQIAKLRELCVLIREGDDDQIEELGFSSNPGHLLRTLANNLEYCLDYMEDQT